MLPPRPASRASPRGYPLTTARAPESTFPRTGYGSQSPSRRPYPQRGPRVRNSKQRAHFLDEQTMRFGHVRGRTCDRVGW